MFGAALKSPGLRVSLAGAVLFLLSAVALLFLPKALAAAGLVAGGLAVWGGFVWTLFSYYGPSARPPRP